MENKIARFMRNTGPARMLVPIGLVLIIMGVLIFSFRSDKFEQTTGTVTSVVETVGDEDKMEYDVSFTYAVDGREYEGEFSGLSESFSEGAEIPVYYDPAVPGRTTNSKSSPLIGLVMMVLGVLAAAFGVLKTVKAFGKSRKLDEELPREGSSAAAALEDIKNASGVTEYYFRFDGNSLKPGYLIEDADRKVLFEGKMTKNALVGARTFEFSDHTTGNVSEHEVGHTVTSSYNDEFFSVTSWFKFDGENIWDMLHARGLRMTTDLKSAFPRFIYQVTRNGEAFARIETSSVYVHEEDEASHKLAIPAGKMYYRIWTASDDFETLFLTVFAISETEQAIVE